MSGVNKVLLRGIVKGDPFPDILEKQAWLCFKIVTTEVVSNNGARDKFIHNVRINAKYSGLKLSEIKHGDILFVQGRLETRIITGTNNVKQYHTEVIVTQLDWHSDIETS